MTKHVIDHPKHGDSTRRAAQYARIEADAMPRPQTLAAQKRKRTLTEGARLKHYTGLERRGDI